MEKKAWPYMAGIIDSEGSIGVSISRKKSGIEAFNVSIQMSNRDRRIIDWIVRNFGGQFCSEIKKNSFNPGSKVFRWSLYGKENQEQFLLGVLPYLVIKRKQADRVLEFLRIGRDTEKRRSIWRELKLYNTQEVSVPETLPKSPDSKAAAFAAGFIDGDGSICGTYHRGMNISAISTDFILIKWFMANFGGRFYCRDRQRPDIKKSKLIYQWFITGSKNKERFLLDVIPYLVIKREQAKCLLGCVRLRRQDPYGRDRLISAEIDALNNKIRNLNSGLDMDSATTEMLSVSGISEIKTQSELVGDDKSAPVKTQEAIN